MSMGRGCDCIVPPSLIVHRPQVRYTRTAFRGDTLDVSAPRGFRHAKVGARRGGKRGSEGGL
jgi:hypothetical protein